jgi:hypothetical protein
MDKSKPSFPSEDASRAPASNRKWTVLVAPRLAFGPIRASRAGPYKDSVRASKALKACLILPLCMLFLAACGPNAPRSLTDAITFDTSKTLDDFEFATAGDGKPGEWSVVDNDAGRALARINTEPSENRLSFAIYRPFAGSDVYVSTRFMTDVGNNNHVAGVFVRFTSVDDYYVARASALENNVGLYRVVAGKQVMIGFMEISVSGQDWHTLGIAAKDERLTVFLDGRELFVAIDRKFPGPPGKIGLWTKADGTTRFESLRVGSLD